MNDDLSSKFIFDEKAPCHFVNVYLFVLPVIIN